MPQTYGSFEQSFHIPPRYFMVKYKLSEDFSELKSQYEDEHNAAVKKKFDDQKILFKGCLKAHSKEAQSE